MYTVRLEKITANFDTSSKGFWKKSSEDFYFSKSADAIAKARGVWRDTRPEARAFTSIWVDDIYGKPMKFMNYYYLG